MAESSHPTREVLESQAANLRKTLDNLKEMDRQGLPVAEAMAKARQQLAAIDAQIASFDVDTPSSTTFDQQGQIVNEQINIAHLYQIYQSAPGQAELTEEKFQKILLDYLGWVRREYGYTRLHGLQTLQDTGPLGRPLSGVYTSLAIRHRPAVVPGGESDFSPRTRHTRQDEIDERAEPMLIDMADLLTLGERVAIVGSAGSGKTTYLCFVAASLAAALLGESLDIRLKPPAKDAPLPVPLLVPLRFWQVYRDEVSQVPGVRITHGPEAGSLAAFLRWFLRARYKNFDTAGDFFDRLLLGGQGCLILLDGLDEVVAVGDRRTVRDEVTRLLDSLYPDNRCLVTAREAGYRDAPFGSDFVRCDVQPMNDDQIATLVKSWCDQIYPQPNDRESTRSELLSAITELNAERVDRGQQPMVTTPLLVSMVVSVKYSRRELPRERAKLYDACVDVVLSSEYSGGEDHAGARRGLVYAGGPPDKQREWLSLLAFRMHRGGLASASIDEDGVRAILEPVLDERGELSLLENFLASSRHRGGIFEERGHRFQFMHLTFQEYLAAQFLSRQWQSEAPDSLVKLVADEWWREALLLTIGSLGAPTPFDQRRDFIFKLCRMDASLPVALAAAELAASGLSDLADPEPILQNVTRKRLVDILTDPGIVEAAPADRAAAGRALAVLGDDRDFDELVAIPAGPFLMGDDEDEDARPRHEVTLPAFKIGKYPVTNAQYRRFVEDTQREWNSQEGRRPELSNCPAVELTWHDARAYCAWLTGMWRQEGKISADEEVRLPTEAEWEKAARGTDGKVFPWGDKWDETRCNTSESGIGRTCAVGIYPDGASPYGVLDMAGNVWEWTSSLWGKDWDKLEYKYPYDSTDGRENLDAGDDFLRVLRGGSWYDDQNFARCAFRLRFYPYYRNGSHGFRVVVSPISAL